jgi:ABC-type dipeptide/oligopeptide/nickel transport system permease component
MLRNAAVPVIAAMGTNFAYLVTGSVIVEAVFTRHGLGWLMVGAINNRDFPLVQGLVLVFGALIVLVSVVSDLMIAAVDPRVSYA